MSSRTDTGRTAVSALTGIGLVIGVVVAILTDDVVLGVIAGSSFIAVTVGAFRLWTGGESGRPHPR